MTTALTDQEAAMLQLLADGISVQQMATKLRTPLGTLKSRKARLYRQLGARSDAHAVSIAYQLGWLTVGDISEDVALVLMARELGCRVALVRVGNDTKEDA